MAESQLAQQLARIESMTNVELRAELKQRGCPTSGNKKDLLAKLRTALQKEHQDTSAELDQTANVAASTILSISSTPVIAIPRVDVDVSLASTPEKTTRARSKRGSTSTPNGAAHHPAPVDVSVEDNHREVNASASTSVDEKDSDVEHVGEKSHLSSLGDTSVRADASVEEVPLPTVTQNDSLTTPVEQPIKAAVEEREVVAPVVVPSSDAKPTIVDEPVTVQKDEPSAVSKETNGITLPAQKAARPQTTPFTKGFNRSTANKLNLSSDLLKTLIPDLTLAPASAVNDELDVTINDDSINGQLTNVAALDSDVDNAEPMTIGDLADGKQPTNRTVVVDVPVDHDELAARKRTNPAADRKANPNIADEPIRIKHAVAAQEPPSQILHISGLTRPFSLFQLKELLGRYGGLVDGEFWLEKIKSQCFVTYKTLDDAQSAREALDGCRWPSTNPKTLSVRFGRAEELQFTKTHDLPPDQMSVDSLDRVMQQQVDVGSSHRSTNGTKAQTDVHESRPAKSNEQARSGFLIEEADEPVPVEEPPAKDLDDYFRKTKAKPYIYWLPLTEEQVTERERRAQQRRAERKENASMSDPNSRHKRKRSFSPSRRR